MAGDLNYCSFIGRLARNPESRFMPTGDQVTSFSIAVGSQWKNKNGEKQESTEWVNCTAFGKLAEIISQYLTKGSQVFVSGRLKTDKYQAKDGSDRYSTKIIVDQLQMLGSKPSGDREEKKFEGGAASAPKGDFSDFESDIPFLSNELYSDSTAISKSFLRARRVR